MHKYEGNERGQAKDPCVTTAPGGPSRAGRFLKRTACILLLLCTEFVPVLARAGGSVTDCTFEQFYTAVFGGGTVRLLCSGQIDFPFQITISADTTIASEGTTPTLSGGGATRLFTVSTGVHLTLVGVTLANGKSTNGGAVFNEGGVVVASNCVFRGNTATGADGTAGQKGTDDFGIGNNGADGQTGESGRGGAFYNLGSLHLYSCQLAANSANGGAGGSGGAGGDGDWKGGAGGEGGTGGAAYGGAIYSLSDLLLSECTLATNSVVGGAGGTGGAAGAGGGLVAGSNGGAGGEALGGAVYSAGPVALVGCTFTANKATGGNSAARGTDSGDNGNDGFDGGRALGGAFYSAGQLQALNNTFYANEVIGGEGGNGGNGGPIGGDGGNGGDALGGALCSLGSASLTNCTFATNIVTGGTAGAAGTGISDGSGGRIGQAAGSCLANLGGTLMLANTLLAGSDAFDNVHGAVVDAGHNLSSDKSALLAGPGSVTGVDPQLGDFGSHGGQTATLSLLAGSPAIDTGGPLPGVETDQRGVPRPQDGGYDIGAYELEPITHGGRVIRGSQPVVGLTITIELAESGAVFGRTVTDATGYYEFTNVVPGLYQILLPSDARSDYTPIVRLLTVTESSSGATNLDFHAVRPELSIAVVLTTQSPSGVSLIGHGAPNTSYQIQSAMEIGLWAPAVNVTSDTAGSFSWIDTGITSNQRCYYRAVVP